MAETNVHTVPHGDGWANVREGSDRASSVHSTQAEAIERGREIARHAHVEHIIHGMNGQIRERNSYGGDPYPPRGYVASSARTRRTQVLAPSSTVYESISDWYIPLSHLCWSHYI